MQTERERCLEIITVLRNYAAEEGLSATDVLRTAFDMIQDPSYAEAHLPLYRLEE